MSSEKCQRQKKAAEEAAELAAQNTTIMLAQYDAVNTKSISSSKDGADFQTLFVLGRAAMSFIEICGGETAFFDAPVNEDNKLLVGAIGFKQNESGRYSVDLRGFFDHPCSHN